MANLTRPQIAALAKTGASLWEIKSALGRALTNAERATVDKARKEAKRSKSKRAPKSAPDPAKYEAHKAAAAERQIKLSQSSREIGELPPVENPERKAACSRNFRLFAETYYPEAFFLEWSDDHLKAIAKIESAELGGGLFAFAMPRGSGKTTLVETAVQHAILYGFHPFVALVGSSAKRAREILESIQTELETNELIAADFPEAVYPVHCLERINHRAPGQTYRGKPTRITWKSEKIVMPTIPDSLASGAVIQAEGIDGSIRGMKHKLANGKSIRPSFVVPDDPQTDESANSPQQCASRLRVLNGAILNLAGPGQKISGVMPCTVIRPDDMVDRILNRAEFPAWQGERTRAFYSFPSDTKLWDQYGDLWKAGFEDGGDKGKAAAAFYVKNRAKMDEGAVVAWPARMFEDDVSPVQHLMNHRLTIGEEAFLAEFQNEPATDDAGDAPTLSVADIAGKLNTLNRRRLPVWTEHVTAMVDLHDDLLYYAVAAWSGNYTGAVVDYGTYPDQRAVRFSRSAAKRTLRRSFKSAGRLGAIRAGLDALANEILAREYTREDGATFRVGRCLVDAGHEPDVVYDFVRASPHASILMPSLGAGIKATNKPMTEYARKRGDRLGWNWYIPAPIRGRAGRYVRLDANHWKQFIHDRLATPLSDPGALALWGRQRNRHTMFAEHIVAEAPTAVTANGRTVGEWSMRPGRSENHWLDCLVGCAVAASMLGAVLPGAKGAGQPKRKRYKRSTKVSGYTSVTMSSMPLTCSHPADGRSCLRIM